MRYRASDYSRQERKLNSAFSAVGYRGEERRSRQFLACNQPDTGEKRVDSRRSVARRDRKRGESCAAFSSRKRIKSRSVPKPEVSREASAKVLDGNGSGSYAKKRCIRLHPPNEVELIGRKVQSRVQRVSTERKKRGKVGQCDMRNVNKVNNVI